MRDRRTFTRAHDIYISLFFWPDEKWAPWKIRYQREGTIRSYVTQAIIVSGALESVR